jgi:PPOX class probable F420-dependent enzyme
MTSERLRAPHLVRELSQAMRAFLEERRYAVLATINPDGSPQQVVMWYLLDGDEIIFNTNANTAKKGNLSRDPRASMLFEDEMRFLRVTGRVRTITDHATTQADIRRIAVRYEGEEAAARRIAATFSKQERVSYRLPLRRIYPKGF